MGDAIMVRRALSFCGLLLLSGAILTWTAGSALAHGGGGHGGGGHGGGGFGGGHVGIGHVGIGHVGIGHVGGYYGTSFGRYGIGYNPGYYGSYYYPYSYGGYNYPYNYGGYSYPYSYGSNYSPYYYGGTYPSSLYNYSPYATGGVALNVQTQPAAPADTTAHIHLNVPANAQVWFAGEKMKSTGTLREFQSPALQPGAKYSYDVMAKWMQDGKEVTQKQTVRVWAGANLNVRFPVPEQPVSQ